MQTVLVIEGDAVARNYSGQILSRKGYIVVQLPSIEETGAWLEKNPGGTKIALFPTSLSAEALGLIRAYKEINPIWVGEKGSFPARGQDTQLLRPFPPAALIETVRAVERKIAKA